MYLAHHERATQTGARLVHACGFDSIPHDLGVQFTVEQLPEARADRHQGLRVGRRHRVGRHVRLGRDGVLARPQDPAGAPERERRRAAAGRAPRADDRRAPRAPGRRLDAADADDRPAWSSRRPHARWTATAPTSATATTCASSNPPVAAALPVGVAGVFALAQLPPTRKAMLKLRPSGIGPDARAARQELVPRPLRRRGRRSPGRHAGQRRRPGLRRDLQDARRIGALPRPRRPAGHRGPGHHRAAMGARAARAPAAQPGSPSRCSRRWTRSGSVRQFSRDVEGTLRLTR